MITSLTSGFPSRLTWTHAPLSRVEEPRVVTFRRSTDAHTPIAPFFAARPGDRYLHAERVDSVAGEEVLPPPMLPVPLRMATRSKIAPMSPKNGSSR